MTAEEVLAKLKILDGVPGRCLDVRGHPDRIQTPVLNGELLAKRWRKRTDIYKANLLKLYAQQPTLEQIKAEAKKRYAHWPQKQVEFTEGAMFAINKES